MPAPPDRATISSSPPLPYLVVDKVLGDIIFVVRILQLSQGIQTRK